MASESQKRRKLQKVMNNILLAEEANYSVARCVNGDSVEHEKEENYIYEDPTGEPVYDDYSLQVIEDRTEYYETISEFCYDSDLEPIDSSDEECELIDDDVIDEDAVQFPFDAMCDDELPTNVHLVDDVPVPDFKKSLLRGQLNFV